MSLNKFDIFTYQLSVLPMTQLSLFDKAMTKDELMDIIQLILIAISFFVLLIKSSELISTKIGSYALNLFSNTVTIGIFIYYLDTIKDLGQALFSLLNFDD